MQDFSQAMTTSEINSLKNRIFYSAPEAFNELALEVFQFQARHVNLYRKYLEYLDINPSSIKKVEEIPFLPVEFFKNEPIITENMEVGRYFQSSGTTGINHAKHYLAEEEIYQQAILKAFEDAYGSVKDYIFYALLPAYAERENSSLVYMMHFLMAESGNGNNHWYLYNHEALANALVIKSTKKKFLMGVSFALLDFAEQFQIDLSDVIVMETGGMKGRRTELIREELHAILMDKFKVNTIHSEYGMTELLSQAYSKGNGIYHSSPWMRILIREVNDPFSYVPQGQTGGINIIDLANLFSCSFIAVKDLGKLHNEDTFEVLGRFDNSDLRGCSLLYE